MPVPLSPARSRFLSLTAGVGVTQIVVLCLNLILVRLIQELMGNSALASYLVAGRLIVLIYPFVLGGLDISLTRSVALNPTERASMLGQGLLYGCASGITVIIAAVASRDVGGRIVFGREGASALFIVSVFFAVSYAFLLLWYSTLRGARRMKLANSLQVSYLLMEIVAALIVPRYQGFAASRVEAFLFLTGISLLSVVLIGSALDGASVRWNGLLLRRLLAYGVPRVPSAVLLAGTFSVPVFFASRLGSARTAAAFAVAILIVLAVETVTAPIGIVLLPTLSAMTLRDPVTLRSAVKSVTVFAIHLGLITSVLLPGLVPGILTIWLGAGYEPDLDLIVLIAIGAGPYATYTVLRHVLNAISEIPVVTILTAASVTVTVIAASLSQLIHIPALLAGSLTLGLSVLGVCSVYVVLRMAHLTFDKDDWRVLLALAVAAAALVAADNFLGGLPTISAFLARAVVRLGWGLGIAILLWRSRVTWFRELVIRWRPVGSPH